MILRIVLVLLKVILIWSKQALSDNKNNVVLTPQEGLHVGISIDNSELSIVREFLKSSWAKESIIKDYMKINDFHLHHQIVFSFCHGRKVKCLWREYYQLLSYIRKPYANLFDPLLDERGEIQLLDSLHSLKSERPSFEELSSEGCDEFIMVEGANSKFDPVAETVKQKSVKGVKTFHISAMTSDIFLRYVHANKPFIIRNFTNYNKSLGEVKNTQEKSVKTKSKKTLKSSRQSKKKTKSSKKKKGKSSSTNLSRLGLGSKSDVVMWHNALTNWSSPPYIVSKAGSATVVISVSPSADFDGPESMKLWSGNQTTNEHGDLLATDEVVIARPAHYQTNLKNYIEFLTSPKHAKLRKKASFYLEYFPLFTVSNNSGVPGIQGGKSLKRIPGLQEEIPEIPWSQFLHRIYQLLWMGGGKSYQKSNETGVYRGVLPEQLNQVRDSVSVAGDKPTNGRLHFDRNENIMIVVAGMKKFTLFSPAESVHVYGGEPVLQGSLKVDINEATGNITFTRDTLDVKSERVDMHTYSPVNIKSPDFVKYPALKKSKALSCSVEKGDLLYVPSHWWHEVESFVLDDHCQDSKCVSRGLSIGINYFFEPYYHRKGYRTRLNVFQYNRFYSHINGAGIKPFSKNIRKKLKHLNVSESVPTLCDGMYMCYK